jgi:hypothetical protein
VGLLKRKAEKMETIWVRVPISAKAKMAALRDRADGKGFDLTASLSDAVLRWMKQVAEELGEEPGKDRRSVAEKGSGVLANGREE